MLALRQLHVIHIILCFHFNLCIMWIIIVLSLYIVKRGETGGVGAKRNSACNGEKFICLVYCFVNSLLYVVSVALDQTFKEDLCLL